MHSNRLSRCVIVLMTMCHASFAAKPQFDIEVPYGFVGPLALKDSRLFAIDRMTMARLFSQDGGRTWTVAGPLLNAAGRHVLGAKRRRGYLPSLLRLKSGVICLKYNLRANHPNSGFDSWIIRSSDDGATWSKPVRITRQGSRSNATWLTVTNSGRLVLPNEYWFEQPGDRGIGICTALYSDDQGKTWRTSRTWLWVWEKNGAWQGACEVPIAVETADGRLLMFMRTSFQRIAQSYSKDGGRNWSPAKLNRLVSSNSEIALARIPTTGDLLCIWNQASTEEINKGFYRARLTSSISHDSGRSWSRLRTIRQSPGQAKLRRISDSGGTGFLRAIKPVPAKQDMLATEFHMNRAPRIHFVGKTVYLCYTHRRYKYVNGKRKRTVNQTRLRAVPVRWFFDRPEQGTTKDR